VDLAELAWDEAKRQLVRQEADLDTLHTRSLAVLSAAAITGGLFAGRLGSHRNSAQLVFLVLALACFAATAFVVVFIQWPRKWDFAHDELPFYFAEIKDKGKLARAVDFSYQSAPRWSTRSGHWQRSGRFRSRCRHWLAAPVLGLPAGVGASATQPTRPAHRPAGSAGKDRRARIDQRVRVEPGGRRPARPHDFQSADATSSNSTSSTAGRSGLPQPCVTHGIPARAAATGAAYSPSSWSTRSGDHSCIRTMRSANVLGAITCAHILVAHTVTGCPSVSGQRRRRSSRICVVLIPADTGRSPAPVTRRWLSSFVAKRTSWPATWRATARSSMGTTWPTAGQALTRMRMLTV
jgi:hypothetical protein